MADTTDKKTYLINIQDNLDVYAQHAEDAAQEVARLKVENEALKNSSTATGAQIEKSNGALRNAIKEYSNAKKNVELATKANVANKNSYEELYRRWQLAQTQLKLMGDGFTTNAKGVRVLSAEYQKQSKVVADAKASLDQFGKGVNDNRLNVGSYGEAIQQAFGGVSPVMGRAAGGVKALSTAFKALLANPIVLLIAAIVAALVALFKAFKSTDSGATEFAARLEQLRAIIDVLRQRLVAITQAIKHVFKGEWKQAGEAMKEVFTGIGDQIKEATRAAYEYTNAMDSLQNSQDNFISQSADIRNAIARLEYTAQDRTKSTAQRKAALEEALRLAQIELTTQRDFAKQKLDLEAAYLAGKNGLRAEDVIAFTKMTDAEQANASEALKTLRDNNEGKLIEIEKLYAAWIDLDTKYYEENKRNISKLSGFEEEQRKEREAKQKELTEFQLSEQKAAFAGRKLLAKDNTEEMIQILEQELEAELAATDIGYNAALLLRTQFNEAVQKLRDEDAKKAKEAADKAAKLAKDDAEAGFEYQRIKAENNLDILEKILDQEYGALLASADYEALTQNQKLLADAHYTEAKRQFSEARIAQVWDEQAMVADALGAISGVLGKETAVGKAFAVAQATINTYLAASQALKDPTLVSTAMKVAAMISIIGTGLANVRNILKVDTSGSGGGSGATALSSSPAVTHITAKPVGASALTPTQTAATVGAAALGSGLTAESIAAALAALPRPVVTVEDINARTAEKRRVEVIATI